MYAKFLAMQLPKQGTERVNVNDKVLLEYYRLKKEFDGAIELESTEGGFTPITGEAGRREQKKDPLTILIDKINDRYGTNFTEKEAQYFHEICSKLQEATGISEMEVLKITFPKCSVRDYLAVPASMKHREMIEAAFTAMEAGVWGDTGMCRIPR